MRIENGILKTSYRSVSKIVQIGCGGTGGYVQYFLSRLLYSLGFPSPRYILCDGDIVEEKNLCRQNFVEADLGENKAAKLAFRYGTVYNIGIEYVDDYIEDLGVLTSLLETKDDYTPILIGAVDNNRSRQLFHQAFEKLSNIIYIDSGNDEITGQVVCGVKYNSEVLLPPLGYIYPDVLEDKDTIFKSEESCGELVASEPQNIATNILAGQIVFSFVNNILTRNELKVYMTTFNSETNNVRPRYIEDLNFQK